MKRRSTPWLWWWCVLPSFAVPMVVLAAEARGQPRAAVDVVFQFSEQQAIDRVTDVTVEQAERAIAEAIVKICNKRFEWWHFRPGSLESFPRMHVFLRNRQQAWELRVFFRHCAETRCEKRWFAFLRSPGDEEELPNGSGNWQSEILGCLIDDFLEDPKKDGETELRDHLKDQVPLAKGPITPIGAPAEGRCVLPLPWDVYSRLATADFELHCNLPGTGSVTLLSHGTCQSMPYVNTGQPGIVVSHIGWRQGPADAEAESIESHRADLADLQVLGVFLIAEDPRTTQAQVANCEELPAIASTGGGS